MFFLLVFVFLLHRWIRGDKSIDNVSIFTFRLRQFNKAFSFLYLKIPNFCLISFCSLFSSGILSKQLDFESNAITESNPTSRARAISRLIIDRSVVLERTFSCVGRSGRKTAVESTTIYPNENSSSDLLGLNAGIGSSSAGGPKKVRILSYYSTIFASIGKSIVLPCKAAGRPHPEIFWLDPEQTMIGTQNPRQKILPNGDLLISPLRWSDMGSWTCVARNPISKDTAETFVYPSVSFNASIRVCLYCALRENRQ